VVHLVHRVALHLSQMRGVDVKASQSTHNVPTIGSVDWSCIGVGRCVVDGSGEVGEKSIVSSFAVVSVPRETAFRWGGSIVVVSVADASVWVIPTRPGESGSGGAECAGRGACGDKGGWGVPSLPSLGGGSVPVAPSNLVP